MIISFLFEGEERGSTLWIVVPKPSFLSASPAQRLMLFNASVSLKARRSAASLLPQGEGGLGRPALVSEAAGEASHCVSGSREGWGEDPAKLGSWTLHPPGFLPPPPGSGAAAATAKRLRLLMTFSDFNANFLTEGPSLFSSASRRCQAQLSASRSRRRSGVLTHPAPPHPRLARMSSSSI